MGHSGAGVRRRPGQVHARHGHRRRGRLQLPEPRGRAGARQPRQGNVGPRGQGHHGAPPPGPALRPDGPAGPGLCRAPLDEALARAGQHGQPAAFPPVPARAGLSLRDRPRPGALPRVLAVGLRHRGLGRRGRRRRGLHGAQPGARGHWHAPRDFPGEGQQPQGAQGTAPRPGRARRQPRARHPARDRQARQGGPRGRPARAGRRPGREVRGAHRGPGPARGAGGGRGRVLRGLRAGTAPGADPGQAGRAPAPGARGPRGAGRAAAHPRAAGGRRFRR